MVRDKEIVQFRDSQSVVPRLAILASPGNLLDMQILGPNPDLLNRKLWEWGPMDGVLKNSLSDSYTKEVNHWSHSSLQLAGLTQDNCLLE